MTDELFSVKDQIVLVSGASRGIGRAIAPKTLFLLTPRRGKPRMTINQYVRLSLKKHPRDSGARSLTPERAGSRHTSHPA